MVRVAVVIVAIWFAVSVLFGIGWARFFHRMNDQ